MPSVERFLDLLEPVSRRDMAGVLCVVREIADEEKKRKHFKAAQKLIDAAEIATASADYDCTGEFT